jgi:hypothetical protein
MPQSTFLSGRAPARLRGLQMLALSDTGNVLTRSFTSDTGGGATQSWAAGSAVQCRIDPMGERGASHVIAGRVDERSTHLVTMTTAGAAVEADDRFVITGRGTFEVTATRLRTDAWTQVFEVVSAT